MSVAEPTAPTGAEATSSTVGPGERKLFTYVGEMIPNQVFVQNQSTSEQANFVMQGVGNDQPEWKLFDILEAGRTRSYMVQWPTQATFWNQGLFQSSIMVYGNGIFPGEQGRNS
jgi:hypothetical protein